MVMLFFDDQKESKQGLKRAEQKKFYPEKCQPSKASRSYGIQRRLAHQGLHENEELLKRLLSALLPT